MSQSSAPVAPTTEARLRLREPPATPHVMYQTWADLLFVHWRVDPARVARTLPEGLYVDTFAGDAYVGVVPFFMRHIRPRYLPSVPGISNFLELNVRTYVHDEHGTPGVWFYSLDCNQPLAVWTARKFFHLPYRHARMTARVAGRRIAYDSVEQSAGRRCALTYELGGVPHTAVPETLEFFLVERYLLFAAAPDGRLFTGRVHHDPYPVVEGAIVPQSAERAWVCELLDAYDFGVDSRRPDHVRGSPGVVVKVFGLR